MAELLRFEIAGFFLVFARIGAVMMFLPGIGDTDVSPRIRLMAALLVSLVVFPAVARHLPPAPANEAALLAMLIGELAIGLALGAIVRILFSALTLTGSLIAVQSGLATATLFNPADGQQSAQIGRFLSLAAVVLMFVGGLHHMIFASLVRSYMFMAPGGALNTGDFAELAVGAVASSFSLGLQLAAPFLVFGLIFNVGLGLMARLTPTIQVFFIAQPLNLLLGFALMLATMGLVLTQFIERFAEALRTFGG